MPISKPRGEPKVAIVHDWLLTYRGGEKVLEAICELYPAADIFTLFYRKGSVGGPIEQHRIQASILNRLPGVERYYRYLLPLLPHAIERFDLSSYDLVISSSHCVAKGVKVPPSATHVCYCHTPMRYIWDRYDDYFGGSLLEPILKPIIRYLQRWDVKSSSRVDHFVANSQYIAERIQKYYLRAASVVYPFIDPSDLEVNESSIGSQNFFLTAAAFAPYKRIDLAITTCEKLGKPLYVAGTGQDEGRLRNIAGSHTKFLGRVSRDELKRLYANCRALLFPGEEDFGIAPIEAMAAGKPVVAFGRGGATETVIDGETGFLFPEQTIDSLSKAIDRFDTERISPESCRAQARKFSRATFLSKLKDEIDSAVSAKHQP